MLHSCFNRSKLKGKYIIRRAIKWFLQSLSKCTSERFENPDVLIRVLLLPQLFKATGFSYLFNAHFDKLCKNQSIFCVAQYLPILYNISRAIKWFAREIWFGIIAVDTSLHLSVPDLQGTSISGNWNEKEAGDWGDKRRERDSRLDLTLPFYFFPVFLFSFFCSVPLALNTWNRQNTEREDVGVGGGHIRGAKMLMAKLNSQMKTLLGAGLGSKALFDPLESHKLTLLLHCLTAFSFY